MNHRILIAAAVIGIGLPTEIILAGELPDTYWSQQQANEILDKTRTVLLAPDLSALTSGEKDAIKKLTEAGWFINRLYEVSMHPEALRSEQALWDLPLRGEHAKSLMDLYSLFK